MAKTSSKSQKPGKPGKLSTLAPKSSTKAGADLQKNVK